MRAVAEVFGLGFVPVATVRSDLVVPEDLAGHPTVKVLMDVLQFSALRREIDALAGYESSVTGKSVAEL
jgi:molybdate-binding protein